MAPHRHVISRVREVLQRHLAHEGPLRVVLEELSLELRASRITAELPNEQQRLHAPAFLHRL